MTKRLPLFSGLAALVFALALAGCKSDSGQTSAASGGAATPGGNASTAPSNPPAGGGGTYKLITNGVSPFWDSLAKGREVADQQLGTHSDWSGPTPAQNAEQVKLFNDAIAAKVDGIGVSVIQPDALQPTIDKAVDGGIPVITFDSDAPKSKRLAYIGTNNYQAGVEAGKATLKQFPNGGKLIAFVGNMSQDNSIERYNGFKDAIKGSNITFIADPLLDGADKNKARQNVEDAITRYGTQGLNGLVGLYSYDGPAILNAVEAHHLRDKMKVICFDGDPQTLAGLAAGNVDVTVVQKPFEFGRLSVMLLNLIKKDKTIDAALTELQPELDKLGMKVDSAKHIIDTGVTVVTKENAAEFLKGLKEKGIEST
jgi:ribose transport system substrate-binding protein